MTVKDFLAFPERAEHLMPNELAVFDLLEETQSSSPDILLAMERISKFTTKISFWVSFERLDELDRQNPRFLKDARNRGLTHLHLFLSLDVPNYTYVGVGHQSPYLYEIFQRVEHFSEKRPFFKIIPCLACPSSQIHHLGPLIALFASADVVYAEIILQPPRRTEKNVFAYRELFEYLRLRGVTAIWISFNPFHADSEVWNMQSFNSFSGPETVHFDISNKCTHSCNFCGLYGEEAVGLIKQLDPKAKADVHSMMTATLDYKKGCDILETLPESVKFIQFGGVGDPMLHPHFMDFIRIVRSRGIMCEVLSNMDYFTEESIVELTRLGSQFFGGLHFIANISGASEEMYLKTRPRQTKKNYQHVINTLSRLGEERKKNRDRGVFFTMMCVLNKTNYSEAEDYVRLSKELGAYRIYLKPMEVHIEHQTNLLIDPALRADYARHIDCALKTAQELSVEVMDQASLLKMIEKNT